MLRFHLCFIISFCNVSRWKENLRSVCSFFQIYFRFAPLWFRIPFCLISFWKIEREELVFVGEKFLIFAQGSSMLKIRSVGMKICNWRPWRASKVQRFDGLLASL